MNDIKIGPTDNELLNYLSWCEATDNEPFAEDEEKNNEEDNNDISNINVKILKKGKDD